MSNVMDPDPWVRLFKENIEHEKLMELFHYTHNIEYSLYNPSQKCLFQSRRIPPC